MGPLVSQEQLDRVTGYLDSGRDEGAKAVAGGNAIDGKGYFVEPTVLTETDPSMRVQAEEIFGPVVTVTPFDDVSDVPKAGNETVYGLAAGIWTSDLSKAHRTARAAARRHGVDQLLQRLRRGAALRRLQAVRLGPRDGRRGARELHRDQGGLGGHARPRSRRMRPDV